MGIFWQNLRHAGLRALAPNVREHLATLVPPGHPSDFAFLFKFL